MSLTMNKGGFTGKTLRVDLTSRTITVEDTAAKYGQFMGGTAMGYKVMWDEVPAGVGPWDPANRIIFGWGPLTGTGAPCCGRTAITSLWPGHANGMISGRSYPVATGHMGGDFSAEAKFAGWDGIIVQGKASNAVYLAIKDDDVQVVDAPQLWGTGIYRITAEIVEAMGPTCQVAAIGQAGQNLVPISNVMTGVSHSAGAVGSVMGSKNLVGIGVVGTGSVQIASAKTPWRSLIENCMTLIGTTYQHVIPDQPQPWAEMYYSASWWKAKKGSFWGAADPPVETGIADPHDRQSIGYRTNIPVRYFTTWGNDYTVRMNGCFGCPLRCHIAVNVPTAARWATEPMAQNTCTGVWLGNQMPVANMPGGAYSDEGRIRTLEAKVLGVHLADDYGIWTHYSQFTAMWTFLTSNASGTLDYGVYRIQPNVSATEWANLNAAYSSAQSTNLSGDTPQAGLFTMEKAGDLGFIRELGRMVAYKVGALGTFLGGPVVQQMSSWKDAAGNPLINAYSQSDSVRMWLGGYPNHHGIEQSGQIGCLINSSYNVHPCNHDVNNWMIGGLPTALMAEIVETTMKPIGYGAGMGAAMDPGVPNTITPMNPQKALIARFAILRQNLHDSLGICDWSYPWWCSPFKERGYIGDLTIEAQLFNLATGNNLSTLALDEEMARARMLFLATQIRAYNTMDMRNNKDVLPWWAIDSNMGVTAFTPGNYRLTQADWNTALGYWYAAWGLDPTLGAPTQETMAHYGLSDVTTELASLGFTLPHGALPTAPTATPGF